MTLAPKLERGRIALLVRQIIRDEKKKADNINVVLVNDDYLLGCQPEILEPQL